MLAHEIGHVLDFDEHPEWVEAIRHLHWSQVPHHMERSAFVRGFQVLEGLRIPMGVEQYVSWIVEPMASRVRCCLLARLTPCHAAADPAHPAARPPAC